MSNSVSQIDISDADLTPGERLKAAREGRQESLKDVAGRTHQSVDTLRALENMATQKMSPTVIRMHAVRYAKAVGLPESEIADAYAANRAMMSVEDTPANSGSKVSAWPKLALAGLGLAVLATGGLSAASLLSGRETNIDTIPVSTRILPSTRSASLEPGNSYKVDARSEFAIRARNAGWIEVRASDGTIFRSREMSRGEVYYPRMDAGWTVTVRDASAFEVLQDGQVIMPFGDEAAPLYSVSIDRMAEQADALVKQQMADAEKQNAAQSR